MLRFQVPLRGFCLGLLQKSLDYSTGGRSQEQEWDGVGECTVPAG